MQFRKNSFFGFGFGFGSAVPYYPTTKNSSSGGDYSSPNRMIHFILMEV